MEQRVPMGPLEQPKNVCKPPIPDLNQPAPESENEELDLQLKLCNGMQVPPPKNVCKPSIPDLNEPAAESENEELDLQLKLCNGMQDHDRAVEGEGSSSAGEGKPPEAKNRKVKRMKYTEQIVGPTKGVLQMESCGSSTFE